jgi:hypothetical protein
VNDPDQDFHLDLRLVFEHSEPLFELDGIRGEYLFLDDQVGEEIPTQGDPYDQTDRYYSYLVLGLRKEKITYPIHGKIGDVAWGGNGLLKAQVEAFASDINRLVSGQKETSLSRIVCAYCLQEGYIDQSLDPACQFRECLDVSDNEMRYKRA